MVFSLCLIVCVLPVSAADEEYDVGNASGAAATSSMLFFYVETNTTSASNRNNFFGVTDDTTEHPILVSMNDGTWVHESDVVRVRRAGLGSGYIEYIFSMPSEGVLTFTEDDPTYYASLLQDNSQKTILYEFDENLEIEFYIDGVLQGTYSISSGVPLGDYDVSQRFSFRILSNDGVTTTYIGDTGLDATLMVELQMNGYFTYDAGGIVPDPTDPTDPNDPSDPSGGGSGSQDLTEVIESIEVVQGHLEEINGNIVEIKDTVDTIRVQIQDTKEQLEDPTSPIWEAAGEAIGNALEGLFVPSEDDIADVKQGFDDLAEEKLGGAHTAMQIVDDTFTQVNDKLNNPSAAEGIQFPGISVPLGGDIGVVELAPAQMVTLPLELTSILHPVAGTIVSIICGLGTFNVLKDMVECFLSGFSYSEFLHRSKGGSDE